MGSEFGMRFNKQIVDSSETPPTSLSEAAAREGGNQYAFDVRENERAPRKTCEVA